MNGLFVRAGLERLGVDTRLVATRAGEATSSTLLAVESDGRRSSFHRSGASTAAPLRRDATVAAMARYEVAVEPVQDLTPGGLPLDRHSRPCAGNP